MAVKKRDGTFVTALFLDWDLRADPEDAGVRVVLRPVLAPVGVHLLRESRVL